MREAATALCTYHTEPWYRALVGGFTRLLVERRRASLPSTSPAATATGDGTSSFTPAPAGLATHLADTILPERDEVAAPSEPVVPTEPTVPADGENDDEDDLPWVRVSRCFLSFLSLC